MKTSTSFGGAVIGPGNETAPAGKNQKPTIGHQNSTTCGETNLLDKQAAARFLAVSVKTLDRWIYEHRGPKFYKVGGVLVRYRHEDLIAFLEACPTGGGSLIRRHPAADSAPPTHG